MEAMRRALPELLKLDRHERRALRRRDRSLYEVFIKCNMIKYNFRLSNLRLFLQNEPNFVYRNRSLGFACESTQFGRRQTREGK